MKLSEAVKCYEECFGADNADGAGGCLYKNCPLYKNLEIIVGGLDEEAGQVTWEAEGCTILGKLEEILKGKKSGTPFPKEK